VDARLPTFVAETCAHELLQRMIAPWGATDVKCASTTAMRIGRVAERPVSAGLPAMLEGIDAKLAARGRRNPFAAVSPLYEEGMRRSPFSAVLVTSLDGRLAALDDADVVSVYAWENKALSADSTLTEARNLAAKYGDC